MKKQNEEGMEEKPVKSLKAVGKDLCFVTQANSDLLSL